MKKGILSELISHQTIILFVLSMIGYLAFSIIIIKDRIPFFDELNAWNISQNCSFTELFEVSRREGHFILWYLLLKPFSLNNFGYWWSLLAVNWVFAFAAVLLMWKKAPFNPWLKVFITFSTPVQMFSVYARCYAIGMFALFAICALYPKRKERPVLYPLLIILLANTSIVGCVAAFVFGLMYCYELAIDLKAKKIGLKDLKKPFIVFSIGSLIILSQIVCYTIPFYSTDFYRNRHFFDFFRLKDYLPRNFVIITLPTMLFLGFFFFRKDKKPLLFAILSSAAVLFIGFKLYVLHGWHYMFLYIFFVCAMWIYMQEHKLTGIWQKTYYAMFFLLSFMTIFYFKIPWMWNGLYAPVAEYLKENIEKFKGAKIFLYPTDATLIGVVPMLKDYDIEFFGPFGTPYTSCKTYIRQWEVQIVDFNIIKAELLKEPERKAFLLMSIIERSRIRDLNRLLKNHETQYPDTQIKLKNIGPAFPVDGLIIYELSL